jgi:hypothetical protein
MDHGVFDIIADCATSLAPRPHQQFKNERKPFLPPIVPANNPSFHSAISALAHALLIPGDRTSVLTSGMHQGRRGAHEYPPQSPQPFSPTSRRRELLYTAKRRSPPPESVTRRRKKGWEGGRPDDGHPAI